MAKVELRANHKLPAATSRGLSERIGVLRPLRWVLSSSIVFSTSRALMVFAPSTVGRRLGYHL